MTNEDYCRFEVELRDPKREAKYLNLIRRDQLVFDRLENKGLRPRMHPSSIEGLAEIWYEKSAQS